ncbi:hypothetical protein TNCV_3399301 [Trichonephila clavipes]|nr:hypothetical protein TNCV_3399301 [Trichonephila clavipes]
MSAIRSHDMRLSQPGQCEGRVKTRHRVYDGNFNLREIEPPGRKNGYQQIIKLFEVYNIISGCWTVWRMTTGEYPTSALGITKHDFTGNKTQYEAELPA